MENLKTHQDPNKKNSRDEVLNDESTEIVNTEEQEEMVNAPEVADLPTNDSDNKQKGYQEGNRNDSLTEPELRDSDDQLEFPEEEGK